METVGQRRRNQKTSEVSKTSEVCAARVGRIANPSYNRRIVPCDPAMDNRIVP
jgi:hypothetical protein